MGSGIKQKKVKNINIYPHTPTEADIDTAFREMLKDLRRKPNQSSVSFPS
jgi:hypothetical protein